MNKKQKLSRAAKNFLLSHKLTGKKPVTHSRIAMFHMGRCGSTVLSEMLNQQGEIYWAGEIFENMHFRYGNITKSPNAEIHILNRSMHEPYSLYAMFRGSSYPKNYNAYGFETKYLREQHLSEENVNLPLSKYLEMLEENGFEKFITLDRKNYLRMIVSRGIGKQIGQWHTREVKEKASQAHIPVDTLHWGRWKGSLIDRLRDLDSQHSEMEDLLKNKSSLKLTYEEHISSDPRVAYGLVCRYLGMQANPVTVKLKKTNPFPLNEIISNWTEVSHALSGTEYEWMLTDELPSRATSQGT